MSFIESRINDVIGAVLYDTAGGPTFNTEIVVVNSGHEKRNVAWAEPRGRWELGERTVDRAELDATIAFFRAVQGRAIGFRFKDWADFAVSHAQGVLGEGVGTGAGSMQIGKKYVLGSTTRIRPLRKPRAGGVIHRNGSLYTGATYSTATGLATLPVDVTRTISGITQANPGVVTTSSAHGYSTGDRIRLSGIGGMTQLNGTVWTITTLSTTTFSIPQNTTGYGAYSGGGNAAKYAQPSDVLTFEGEFDLAVRFDTDQLRSRFDALGTNEALHYLYSLPIVEIRV